ncbi:hypothetical protein AAMO2058_001277700 [Amorphochlora amoebiformis]
MQRASQKKRSVDVASLRSMEIGEAGRSAPKGHAVSSRGWSTGRIIAIIVGICIVLYVASRPTPPKSDSLAVRDPTNTTLTTVEVPPAIEAPAPPSRFSTPPPLDQYGSDEGSHSSFESFSGRFDADTIKNLWREGLHKANDYFHLTTTLKSSRLPIPVTTNEFGASLRNKRFKLVGQKGITLWVTARDVQKAHDFVVALESRLLNVHRLHTYRIESGHLSQGLNHNLRNTDVQERNRRGAEACALMADSGTVVIANLHSPSEAIREWVRRTHIVRGILFLEVYIDQSDNNAEDDPEKLSTPQPMIQTNAFEPPLSPDITVKAASQDIDGSIDRVVQQLLSLGVSAGQDVPKWYPLQTAPDGGFNWEAPKFSTYSKAAAGNFPKVVLSDVDFQWVQCIGEGWAAPLRGFMREGTLLQTLHFNSLLIDPNDLTGNAGFHEKATNFDDYSTLLQKGERVNMPIPVILPITERVKRAIGSSKSVSLVSPIGKIVAVITNPEIYPFRKEEMIARVFGGWDSQHPYIQKWMAAGNYLIGGEVELLERIRYSDGLDKYRLTPAEVRQVFKQRSADAVYAFQTRNPTHAGHAHLMQQAKKRLEKQGFRKPTLWLSPLGGWSKSDDVPLDVRIAQHVEVIEAGMLPESTVLSIWPSPMLYAGPTEVQWHAKSRRNAGARFFITGRDPAGIKRSKHAGGGDFYKGDHGRYVLQTSPGLGDMKILSFGKVFYDKKDQTMKPRDDSRKNDFLSISGSKMRAMARKGVKPCAGEIPDDWEDTLNCVPPGFMVPDGWQIMIEYYQNPNLAKWIPYSRPMGAPQLASEGKISEKGTFGKLDWQLHFQDRSGNKISPWHDIPLALDKDKAQANMVIEMPQSKLEILQMQKSIAFNPIAHSSSGKLAQYITLDIPEFNLGFLPQTWRNPTKNDTMGFVGDGSPVNVIEVGGNVHGSGTVVEVNILGFLTITSRKNNKADYFIIAIDRSVENQEFSSGRVLDLMEFLLGSKVYDVGGTDGEMLWADSNRTSMLFSNSEAIQIIQESHGHWNELSNGKAYGEGFYLSGGLKSVPPSPPKMEKKPKKAENKTDMQGPNGTPDQIPSEKPSKPPAKSYPKPVAKSLAKSSVKS